MKKLKQKDGITLIALVITIIVLLILAGVTISMLTGDNGILKYAQDSETQQTRAAIIEIAEIAYDTGTIEKITGNNTQNREDLVATELIKAGYDVKIEKGETPITEINLSKENVNLYIDSEDEIINITYQDGYENRDSRYFVAIKGLYYEIIFQSKKIALAETPTNLEDIDTETATLEITTDDEEKSIIEILTVGQTITITPKGIGTATITVKKENLKKECIVTVKLGTVENLKAGEYVNYVDKSGTTRKCIVLYDTAYNTANGTNYGTQIITADTVGTVELGNGTGKSDFSSDGTHFNKAKTSYNNAISTLNTKVATYLNTTYASSARCVGSVPNDPTSESGYFTTTEMWMTTFRME